MAYLLNEKSSLKNEPRIPEADSLRGLESSTPSSSSFYSRKKMCFSQKGSLLTAKNCKLDHLFKGSQPFLATSGSLFQLQPFAGIRRSVSKSDLGYIYIYVDESIDLFSREPVLIGHFYTRIAIGTFLANNPACFRAVFTTIASPTG